MAFKVVEEALRPGPEVLLLGAAIFFFPSSSESSSPSRPAWIQDEAAEKSLVLGFQLRLRGFLSLGLGWRAVVLFASYSLRMPAKHMLAFSTNFPRAGQTERV